MQQLKFQNRHRPRRDYHCRSRQSTTEKWIAVIRQTVTWAEWVFSSFLLPNSVICATCFLKLNQYVFSPETSEEVTKWITVEGFI